MQEKFSLVRIPLNFCFTLRKSIFPSMYNAVAPTTRFIDDETTEATSVQTKKDSLFRLNMVFRKIIGKLDEIFYKWCYSALLFIFLILLND
jgi:hypothetical protein